MTTKNNGKNSGKSPSNRLQGLFGSSARKSGLDADWSEVEPIVLRDCIWAVDQLGGAITFSSTRNNNAYVFKVYMGAAFDPVYFDGDQEGREQMRAWVEQLVIAAAESA